MSGPFGAAEGSVKSLAGPDAYSVVANATQANAQTRLMGCLLFHSHALDAPIRIGENQFRLNPFWSSMSMS